MLIESLDQEFKKGTTDDMCHNDVFSPLPWYLRSQPEWLEELMELGLEDRLPRWLLNPCIWCLGWDGWRMGPARTIDWRAHLWHSHVAWASLEHGNLRIVKLLSGNSELFISNCSSFKSWPQILDSPSVKIADEVFEEKRCMNTRKSPRVCHLLHE